MWDTLYITTTPSVAESSSTIYQIRSLTSGLEIMDLCSTRKYLTPSPDLPDLRKP